MGVDHLRVLEAGVVFLLLCVLLFFRCFLCFFSCVCVFFLLFCSRVFVAFARCCIKYLC